jgi:hypothetical protein
MTHASSSASVSTAATTSVEATERTIVRGRRQTPSEARLPANETGLEVQPSRFSAGMWAVILFVSSEAIDRKSVV